MGSGKRGRTTLEERQKLKRMIEEAVKEGARKEKACQVLGVSVRTLQRWEKEQEKSDGRRGPKENKKRLSEEERKEIVEIANSSKYANLSPKKIVPMLTDEGRYVACESSFYRVLREKGQTKERGRAARRQKREVPREVAVKPNEVWSWDISWLKTWVVGQFLYLYMMEDMYSRKIVGYRVELVESSEYGAQMVQEALIREEGIGKVRVLHSDNGSAMKGSTMLATLQKLGVMASFSRPSVSDDNPYSEALFKTLKYVPSYPEKGFESLEEARKWVEKFVEWYNKEHLHSKLKYVTPETRHRGEDEAVLLRRKEVYEEAKKRHPERWSGETRNWNPEKVVYLNKPKLSQKEVAKTSSST